MSELTSVCITRFECGLPCKGCIFYGKKCEKFKKKHKNLKPHELEIYNERFLTEEKEN